MTPTEDRFEEELYKELAIVRDAGAQDDNFGGEDWTNSDRAIDMAVTVILAAHQAAITAAVREFAERLKKRMYLMPGTTAHVVRALEINQELAALTSPGKEGGKE